MASSLVAVPLKSSDKLSFVLPVKKHIKNVYKEDPERFSNDANDLDKLRAEATGTFQVDVLTRYLQQLTFLSLKFPFGENAIKLQFMWSHAFVPKKKVAMPMIKYERAAVLFNLAAAYSQLGAKQNVQTVDGLKMCCHNFLAAAGIFDNLKSLVEELYQNGAPSSDLSINVVKMLVLFMLAQAQETVFLTYNLDAKKDTMLAKLAGATADLYDQAYDVIASEAHKQPLDERNEFLYLVQAKALYYHGVSHTRQAAVDISKDKYAEEIARLQAAFSFLKKALELAAKGAPALQADIKVYLNTVTTRLPRAEKDNGLIYHMTVPDLKELAPIDRAFVAKLSPFELDLTKVHPLFKELVPLGVLQASQEYNSLKTNMVNQQINLIDQAVASIAVNLESMNLPASVDALMQPIGLPQRVIERAQRLRGEGGVNNIVAQVEGLKVANDDLHEIITEAEKILDEEKKQDVEMRHNFSSQWSRVPSDKLTENLRRELSTFRETLRTAATTDGKLNSYFSSNRAGLEAVSGSTEDLERSIPSTKAENTPVITSPEVRLVKSLLEQVPVVKAEFEKFREDLKASAGRDDIVAFLLELNIDSVNTQQQHSLIQDRLHEKYHQLVTTLNDLISRKDAFLASIREANQKFSASRKGAEVITARENALHNMDVAFNAFDTLNANLRDATKFYSDMQQAVSTFMNKCADFSAARKAELSIHLADLQSSSTGMTVQRLQPQQPYQSHQQPFFQSFAAQQIAPQQNYYGGQYGQLSPFVARFDPMTGQPLQQQQPQSQQYKFS